MMMRPLTDTSFARNGIAAGDEPPQTDGFLPKSRNRTRIPPRPGYRRRHRETHDFLIKIFTAALIGSVN